MGSTVYIAAAERVAVAHAALLRVWSGTGLDVVTGTGDRADVARMDAAAGAVRAGLGGPVLARAQADAEAARWALALTGRAILRRSARRVGDEWMDREDLEAEGLEGLYRAATLYRIEYVNGRPRTSFPTYAWWWVRAYQVRAVAAGGHGTRMSRFAREIRTKVQTMQRERAALGAPPMDPAELAEVVGAGEDVIRAAMAVTRPVSLWGGLDDEREECTIPGDDGREWGDALDRARQTRTLAGALDALTPRERAVVERRYGLGTDTPRSNAATGRELGVSRERVRQIERGARESLRAALGARV